MSFRVNVDTAAIAEQLRTDVEQLQQGLKDEVKTLAIRTHAHIVEKARSELSGFMLESYLGRSTGGNMGSNLRLVHVSDVLHVIELDEKAGWIEDGREPTFMGWLLNSSKAKTAKDGSRYLAVPMTLSKLAGAGPAGRIPALDTMAKAAAKTQARVPLRRIQYGSDGKPVIGTIKKLEIPEPSRQLAGFHSMPRSPEMAKATGLKEHSGIFFGDGASLRQRKIGKTKKVAREVGTFRIISSKHKQEGRWIYPKVNPFGGIKEGYEWAQAEMNQALAQLGATLGL